MLPTLQEATNETTWWSLGVPGGKVHADESCADAVRRELSEELGIETQTTSKAIALHHDVVSGYQIAFIPAEIRGEPECREHDEIGWFKRDQIKELPLAPADELFANEFFSENDR